MATCGRPSHIITPTRREVWAVSDARWTCYYNLGTGGWCHKCSSKWINGLFPFMLPLCVQFFPTIIVKTAEKWFILSVWKKRSQVYLTSSAVFVVRVGLWCRPCWNLGLVHVFSPVTRDGSVGGSYLGCEPMGLFWSLQPAPGGREGLRQVIRSGSPRTLTSSWFSLDPLCNSMTWTFDTKQETRTWKLQLRED